MDYRRETMDLFKLILECNNNSAELDRLNKQAIHLKQLLTYARTSHATIDPKDRGVEVG